MENIYNKSEFTRIEELMKGQSEVLQLITQGKSLNTVLDKLTTWVEKQSSENLVASILTIDEAGRQLYHCAGNRLDQEYIEAINGLVIGPQVGSCGTAAYTRQPVIVENIAENILWKDFRTIALKHNLHACWSTPLINHDGVLRGTFAIYYHQPKKPTEQDLQLITLVAHTALLAMEHARAEDEKNKHNQREKLIAENIRKSEERFQNLVREAPVGIVVLRGEDMVVDVVNEMYSKLINRTPEQLLNQPLFDVIPDAIDPYRALLEEVRLTGQTIRKYDQLYHVVVDGKEISGYLNIIYQPYREFDGSISGVMALCHDVTELVNARNHLEQSEQQVRSLVESAPFPIGVYVGKEMRIQFANQAIKDVWGKGNEVEGKLYSEILPELANQRIFQQLDQVYTTGIPFHAKNQRVDLVVDGELQAYYFNYSFTPLYNSEGKIYGVMNTAAEVTELVTAYQDLEKSEARARLAIQVSEQGTFDVNLSTNHITASPRLAEIFDVENEAERDRYITALHPDDVASREKAYELAKTTGILDYDARIIKKDGFIHWLRIKGKFYYNDKHEPERLVGIVQDITEHKNFAEALNKKVQERTQELQHANKQLHAMNEELQQFAYISSHDLQEPLRKIRIFGGLLSKSINKDNEEAMYLQKIHESADRMSGLIQSLLEYSRMNNTSLQFENICLSNTLKSILSDYELLIAQKKATIEIDPLPSVKAVPILINQLFFNLIGNALKFTKPHTAPVIQVKSKILKGEELSSVPGLQKSSEYYAISIHDNGIGFDQAFASKIFTVFQRLHNRQSFEGFGIGLALCKKVVHLHGGEIFAESIPLQGSVFTVILPA